MELWLIVVDWLIVLKRLVDCIKNSECASALLVKREVICSVMIEVVHGAMLGRK